MWHDRVDQAGINGTGTAAVDTQVVPHRQRRHVTVSYQLRILQEADAYTKPGQSGALLRRAGRYCSNLSPGRRQRARGALNG